MKKILLVLMFPMVALAQPYLIDQTTPHGTGSSTTYYGDNALTWSSKDNSNTVFFANWLAGLTTSQNTFSNASVVASNSLLVLTLTVNTNTTNIASIQSTLAGITNGSMNFVMNHGTNYTLGGTFAGDGTALLLNGTNLQSGTVNSNAFDPGTLQLFQQLSTATMNFDGGTITSDGSGFITARDIKPQYISDSTGSSASPGYYPAGNSDSSGWTWTAWPATLSYDYGAITSDGAGNLQATGLRSTYIYDKNNQSGTPGNVLTVLPDYTWGWQTPAGGGASYNFSSDFTVTLSTNVALAAAVAHQTDISTASNNLTTAYRSAISATNTATLTTVTGLLAGASNGLTTNIQFTDTAVLGGSTNTLHFTNGILKAVTSL